MKKVVIKDLTEKYIFSNGDIGVVDKVKNKEGVAEYIIKSPLKNCRGYIGEGLLGMLIVDTKTYPKWREVREAYQGYNYKTGSSLFLVVPKSKELLLTNLKWLHEREKKAGVKLSKVFATQNPRVFLIESSKYWKTTCWKIMLFTYFLRCISIFTDPSSPVKGSTEAVYRPALNKKTKEGVTNEDVFLTQVKNPKEVYDKKYFYVISQKSPWEDSMRETYYGWHDCEGFFSICTGRNNSMAELLGINSEASFKEAA